MRHTLSRYLMTLLSIPSRGIPSRGIPSRGIPSRGIPSRGTLSAPRHNWSHGGLLKALLVLAATAPSATAAAAPPPPIERPQPPSWIPAGVGARNCEEWWVRDTTHCKDCVTTTPGTACAAVSAGLACGLSGTYTLEKGTEVGFGFTVSCSGVSATASFKHTTNEVLSAPFSAGPCQTCWMMLCFPDSSMEVKECVRTSAWNGGVWRRVYVKVTHGGDPYLVQRCENTPIMCGCSVAEGQGDGDYSTVFAPGAGDPGPGGVVEATLTIELGGLVSEARPSIAGIEDLTLSELVELWRQLDCDMEAMIQDGVGAAWVEIRGSAGETSGAPIAHLMEQIGAAGAVAPQRPDFRDLNFDGDVGVSDIVDLLDTAGGVVVDPSIASKSDLNGDGIVDIDDLTLWLETQP